MSIKNNLGFTLIELIIIFSLIAIIAGVGVPITTNYISRQRNFEQMRDFVANLRTYQAQAIAEDKNTFSFSIAGSQIFFKEGTSNLNAIGNPFVTQNSSLSLNTLGDFISSDPAFVSQEFVSQEFVSSVDSNIKVIVYKYGRIQF